jgi:hypothetical protein
MHPRRQWWLRRRSKRQNTPGKLRQHLDACKEKLREEAAGADPTTLAAYQRERDRVVEFMRKHHLSMGEERRG